VGGPPGLEAPIAPEDSEAIDAEPVASGESSWVSGLVNRSRGVYRRTTSPVMASLIAHAAVMILAVSITVASIEGHDAGSTTTTLLLGEKTSKEAETFDPHQLADLGETGVPNAMAELPRLEAVGP